MRRNVFSQRVVNLELFATDGFGSQFNGFFKAQIDKFLISKGVRQGKIDQP